LQISPGALARDRAIALGIEYFPSHIGRDNESGDVLARIG